MIKVNCETPDRLEDFVERLKETKDQVKAADPIKSFFAAELWGEYYDIECETEKDAIAWIQDHYERQLESDLYLPNEDEEEATIIEFRYDDNGEKVILDKTRITLYYEQGESDFVHHGSFGTL